MHNVLYLAAALIVIGAIVAVMYKDKPSMQDQQTYKNGTYLLIVGIVIGAGYYGYEWYKGQGTTYYYF